MRNQRPSWIAWRIDVHSKFQLILIAKREGVPCTFCGSPFEADDWDVVVEAQDTNDDDSAPVCIWHRRCFEAYLDQGEEC